MVVVVPTFAQCDQRQPEIVAAVVAGLVALGAEHVGERVDSAGAVRQGDGRDKESPDQHLGAVRAQTGSVGVQRDAEAVHGKAEERGDYDVITIQKSQFRKLGEVSDVFEIRREVDARREPADVGPPEAIIPGGVGIVLRIGDQVMRPVMPSPPERPALGR